MARLVYSAITSLDGYVADAQGNFDWAEPDEELHTFVNALERPIGTYLYGRRMYETMQGWEDPRTVSGQATYVHDFAEIWRAADKIVYSTTLRSAPTARTRIERAFDAEGVRALKRESASDVTIGGPTLAAHAIAAGLVDDYHLFVTPVLVGGGTPALPAGVRADLTLADQHVFRNGVVHLHYRPAV